MQSVPPKPVSPMQRISSHIFQVTFYIVTFLFAVPSTLLAFLPGRAPLIMCLTLYTRTVRWLLSAICEVEVEIVGAENLPKDSAYIIASKHQSYGDGIMMLAHMGDLSFVADRHLERIIMLRRILRKAGAIMVDNCGGADAQEKLTREAERVRAEQRKLLIYPEGHLSLIGSQHRYRKGVYFMQKDFGCPVVPVATNLGQRWNQNDILKYPGKAVIEFLPPIEAGLEKEAFMAKLEELIETRSIALLDLDDPGALDPANIGKMLENDKATEKRLAKEEAERYAIIVKGELHKSEGASL